MDSYNDFFTLQSLGTFAGAVGATAVVTNGLQRAFDFNPKWLALLLAEVVCLVIVYFTHAYAPAGTQTLTSDYFVAVINGFLVFCSAAGVTGIGSAAVHGAEPTSNPAPSDAQARGPGAVAPSRRSRGFWSRWP
jgi:hypothetical protein